MGSNIHRADVRLSCKRGGTVACTDRRSKHASVLDNLEPDVPFFLRTDWIRALAALTSVYRTEVDRVAPGPNRKVFQLLHSAAAAGRSEWYFNNLRMRHLLEPSRLSLLPIGTTSNEALHHEINNWFRETQKFTKLHCV